jgi:hypothetical protein
MAFPRGLADQNPRFTGSTATLPEFNLLTPWTFWIQAAGSNLSQR